MKYNITINIDSDNVIRESHANTVKKDRFIINNIQSLVIGQASNFTGYKKLKKKFK